MSIHGRAHISASFLEVTIFRTKQVHRSKKQEVTMVIPFTII